MVYRLAFLLSLVLSASSIFTGCGEVVAPEDTIGTGGSLIFSWQAPTTNEDGTPLTDLLGYKLYYGATSGYYDNELFVGNTTYASLDGLPREQDLFFAVSAIDNSGNESALSNEVSAYLPATN